MWKAVKSTACRSEGKVKDLGRALNLTRLDAWSQKTCTSSLYIVGNAKSKHGAHRGEIRPEGRAH